MKTKDKMKIINTDKEKYKHYIEMNNKMDDSRFLVRYYAHKKTTEWQLQNTESKTLSTKNSITGKKHS